VLAAGLEFPKAENLLITKGKVLHFSLPKAENILKINQLAKWPFGEMGRQIIPANWRTDESRRAGTPPGHSTGSRTRIPKLQSAAARRF
jgi:hypothetical protein